MVPVWPKCSTPKGPHAVAVDGAEPAERCRVAVEHADDAAIARHFGEEPLDMGADMHQVPLVGATAQK